jgi:hypothetical protein
MQRDGRSRRADVEQLKNANDANVREPAFGEDDGERNARRG